MFKLLSLLLTILLFAYYVLPLAFPAQLECERSFWLRNRTIFVCGQGANGMQVLYKDHDAFTFPHWFAGYNKLGKYEFWGQRFGEIRYAVILSDHEFLKFDLTIRNVHNLWQDRNGELHYQVFEGCTVYDHVYNIETSDLTLVRINDVPYCYGRDY